MTYVKIKAHLVKKLRCYGDYVNAFACFLSVGNDEGGALMMDRLYSSSLIILVSRDCPQTVKVCHFKKGNEICTCTYDEPIISVKLSKQVGVRWYIFWSFFCCLPLCCICLYLAWPRNTGTFLCSFIRMFSIVITRCYLQRVCRLGK